MNARQKRIVAACRELQPEADSAALEIGHAAELPLRETSSAALLMERLAAHGFEFREEYPSVPNSFSASWGRGKPVIGILAEYDALPDCGPHGRGPGHGCGHNLLGAASAYAAIAAARYLEQARIRGTVKLLGCPAEETLVGKVYMARDGAFDGLDACLAWHPGASNAANNGSGTAMDSLTYEFFGKTAHAAGNPHDGRSALDAVEIMNVAVNFLREHVPSDTRIHYAVMDGGKAPNVVPSYARSWYYVRGKDRAQVEEVSARVHNCARAAALATDTRMKRTLLSACYDRLRNDVLAAALQANLKLVGGPRFTDEDREVVKRLGLTGELRSRVSDISTGRGAGSSDEANVSWITPLSVLGVACWAEGTPGHHWLVHEQSVSSVGLRGLAVAIQVLALTAADLMCDRDLLARAKREFRKRSGGKAYDPLIPARQPAPVQDLIP